MARISIMKGLPASGKSTRAAELIQDGNSIRVNNDLMRTMLHFDKWSFRKEKITQEAVMLLAKHFLNSGTNVIVDNTNLNPKVTQKLVELGKETESTIEYCDMTDVPIEECIARDNIREKKVGKQVIQKMALQHLDYLKGQNVVVCDLDGTLCDVEHRRHFVQQTPKNWMGFFENISGDKLRRDVSDLVSDELTRDTGIHLILVSARPENYREVTEKWLKDNYYYNYTALIMREANDSRPDTEVKSDIYDKYLKNLNIVKVFDDRPSVIRMWKEKGLDVVDVGNGKEF